MSYTATTTTATAPSPLETVTIRMATSADAAALTRLAELDSARPPAAEAPLMLLAEVDGELRAAVPLDGGRAIADPFRRTAELVAILSERARQLSPGPAAAARRRRSLRALRPASASRA